MTEQRLRFSRKTETAEVGVECSAIKSFCHDRSLLLSMSLQCPFFQLNTNFEMKQSFLLVVVLVAKLSVGNGQTFR